MLLGYRHSFNGTGTGFYCEAGLGYTVGTTDIVKHDANGQTIYVPSSISGYDKESVQSANGLTSAVGAGYCFGGKVAINLGIQYRRVFVAGESDLNVFSFRVSHPLNFGKKKEKE